eukprot:Colp12_sorted_trinity150504_noHs@15188
MSMQRQRQRFGAFEHDPFLSDFDATFGRMDAMMRSFIGDDFFGAGFRRGVGSMGGFAGGFSDFSPMLDQIENMRGTGSSYSYSSFQSYTTGPDRRPVVVEKSKSVKKGPGGIKESQESLRDSRDGTQKLTLQRQIGDRSRIVERSRNQHTGEERTRQELKGLAEHEADAFDQEFIERAASHGLLTSSPPRRSSSRNLLGHGYRGRSIPVRSSNNTGVMIEEVANDHGHVADTGSRFIIEEPEDETVHRPTDRRRRARF